MASGDIIAGDDGSPVALAGDDAGRPLRRALAIRLALVVRQMHRSFDQRMAHLGVTRAQWTMIAVIAANPGITQREAAAKLDTSEAAAGRIIDRLCTDGILDRTKTRDRRAYAVALTAAGLAMVDRIDETATLHERTVFDGFAIAELDGIRSALDRLLANIGPRAASPELPTREARD